MNNQAPDLSPSELLDEDAVSCIPNRGAVMMVPRGDIDMPINTQPLKVVVDLASIFESSEDCKKEESKPISGAQDRTRYYPKGSVDAVSMLPGEWCFEVSPEDTPARSSMAEYNPPSQLLPDGRGRTSYNGMTVAAAKRTRVLGVIRTEWLAEKFEANKSDYIVTVNHHGKETVHNTSPDTVFKPGDLIGLRPPQCRRRMDNPRDIRSLTHFGKTTVSDGKFLPEMYRVDPTALVIELNDAFCLYPWLFSGYNLSTDSRLSKGGGGGGGEPLWQKNPLRDSKERSFHSKSWRSAVESPEGIRELMTLTNTLHNPTKQSVDDLNVKANRSAKEGLEYVYKCLRKAAQCSGTYGSEPDTSPGFKAICYLNALEMYCINKIEDTPALSLINVFLRKLLYDEKEGEKSLIRRFLDHAHEYVTSGDTNPYFYKNIKKQLDAAGSAPPPPPSTESSKGKARGSDKKEKGPTATAGVGLQIGEVDEKGEAIPKASPVKSLTDKEKGVQHRIIICESMAIRNNFILLCGEDMFKRSYASAVCVARKEAGPGSLIDIDML